VGPKFSKLTRNACGMVLLSSSWVCFVDDLKKTNLLVHNEMNTNGKFNVSNVYKFNRP